MSEALSPVLRDLSDAVLAVASNVSVEQVLQRLVDVARGLVERSYAAARERGYLWHEFGDVQLVLP